MSTAEKDDGNLSSILVNLDDRIASIERKVFGSDINSKIRQKRQVIDELIQINGQIQRSLPNRESISKLMKSVEEILDVIQLEDSSNQGGELLGSESKANAILLAEPIIRQMHSTLKNFNVDEVNEAINSKDIRDIISLKEELSKLKFQQLEDVEPPIIISSKIQTLTEAIDMLITNSTI